MVLHEYYFGNMTKNGSTDPGKQCQFYHAAQGGFGSYDIWKADFVSIGKMRGVGWAICFQDPKRRRLTNQWVTLHEMGNIAGFEPVLVMDVWEHAFLLDYKPAERPKYIEAFFANIDWSVVERRLSLCPWLWWKFDSSVSEPGIFLSQLPYNERPQIQPRLEHPPSRCFQR